MYIVFIAVANAPATGKFLTPYFAINERGPRNIIFKMISNKQVWLLITVEAPSYVRF